MKQLSLNKLLVTLLSLVFVICTALGVIGFANRNVRAEGETTTYTYFKGVAEIKGGQGPWVWFHEKGTVTPNQKALGEYEKIRIIIAASKVNMVREINVSFTAPVEGGTGYVSYNNWNLTLKDGEKNVIELTPEQMTLTGVTDVNAFVPTSLQFLIQTNKDGYTESDVTKLTAGVQLVGTDDTNTDFDNIEYDATEEPSQKTTTYTYFKGVAEISGGKSDWIWFSNGGTITPNQKALGEYEKIRIIVAASKASMIREINASFTAPVEGGTGYVSYNNWNLTLKDGEKNVIELTPEQMTLTDVTDVNAFVPTSLQFLIHTDKEGYTESDVTKLTAGVQLVGTDDTNTDFDNIEYDTTEPEVPEETETHTFFKARAKITGGSADWIWVSNNAAATAATKTLGSYSKVRIILAATKANIIREVLISLDSEDGKRFSYNNYNLDLKEGKNVIEVNVSDLYNNGGADLSTHIPKTCEFIIHADKAGATTSDVTYLTAGIQFVGTNDNNTDFDNIEYDPEMVTSHTFFKNTKEITGGVGADGSWIWLHEGATAVANEKKLGAYSKVRFILAATKAEMISEINVTVYDASENYVSYNNWQLNMEEGKTVIELTLDQLTISSGVTDVAEFVPESVSFLVRTNKEEFTADDKTKLTAGVQFVGDKENSDFDEIEYDPYEEPDVTLLTDHVFLSESSKTVKGGSSNWIGIENAENINPSAYFMDKYAGVKVIIEGEKASMISQYNLVIGDTASEYIADNYWNNFKAKDGKNEYLIAIKDMKTGGNVNLANFRPTKMQFGIQTTKGTDADECEIKVTIVFVTEKDSITTDVKLFDFDYKGGVVYDKESDSYIDDRGTIVGNFGPNNGQDQASGGCKVTVVNNAANGQIWLTTGGRWKDQKPVDVTPLDTLYFQDFNSLDLYFYVSDANYVENIMITMGSGDGCWYDAPALQKIIGIIENSGWQHLRLNLDSMTPIKGFDWDVKTEFISIEMVVTVRVGTPVDEVLIFDDFYLRQERCDPTIELNNEYALTGTTGTEIDLANSVIAAHPFGDKINTSFGVKFAKEENGNKSVVTASGGKFTPNKAGYYFVTAIVTDSMGASAQVEFTITITGDDIDAEEPSISFGSTPAFMAQPGELDLSGIKVTDDLDENPTVVITVTDKDGNELTITNNKVNITKAGTYKITVTATDAANHTKTLTRNVTVEGGSSDNPSPTPGTDKSGGCGGAIGATSMLATGIIALAVAKLRKKED